MWKLGKFGVLAMLAMLAAAAPPSLSLRNKTTRPLALRLPENLREKDAITNSDRLANEPGSPPPFYDYDASVVTNLGELDWRIAATFYTATIVVCIMTFFGFKIVHDIIICFLKANAKGFVILISLIAISLEIYHGGILLKISIAYYGGAWYEASLGATLISWALVKAYFVLWQRNQALDAAAGNLRTAALLLSDVPAIPKTIIQFTIVGLLGILASGGSVMLYWDLPWKGSSPPESIGHNKHEIGILGMQLRMSDKTFAGMNVGSDLTDIAIITAMYVFALGVLYLCCGAVVARLVQNKRFPESKSSLGVWSCGQVARLLVAAVFLGVVQMWRSIAFYIIDYLPYPFDDLYYAISMALWPAQSICTCWILYAVMRMSLTKVEEANESMAASFFRTFRLSAGGFSSWIAIIFSSGVAFLYLYYFAIYYVMNTLVAYVLYYLVSEAVFICYKDQIVDELTLLDGVLYAMAYPLYCCYAALLASFLTLAITQGAVYVVEDVQPKSTMQNRYGVKRLACTYEPLLDNDSA